MFTLITIIISIIRALMVLIIGTVCIVLIGKFSGLIIPVLCIALYIGSIYAFEWLFCAVAEYFGQDVSRCVGYHPHGKRFKKGDKRCL